MERKPLRIAFYGKGGIGKSTIAAHVSTALAMEGKRVLHIGCDPKADSTRCLSAERVPTVLDTLNTQDAPLSRSQVVFPGAFGVSCVEAGGPQAGVGCAGLGITAMVDELNRLGILEEPWDAVIYDVLGDVVCGGFAVPMRKHFADQVYLVTTVDFMSLYAANNITKGVARYSAQQPMMGGLILNHSRSQWEEEFAETFASQTHTKVVGVLPEDDALRRADYLRTTVHALAPEGESSARLKALAGQIWRCRDASVPAPLEQDALEALCRGAAGKGALGFA